MKNFNEYFRIDDKEVGKRFKFIIKKKLCLSQKELAELMQVAPNHVSMMCTGKRHIPFETAIYVCSLLPDMQEGLAFLYGDFL